MKAIGIAAAALVIALVVLVMVVVAQPADAAQDGARSRDITMCTTRQCYHDTYFAPKTHAPTVTPTRPTQHPCTYPPKGTAIVCVPYTLTPPAQH